MRSLSSSAAPHVALHCFSMPLGGTSLPFGHLCFAASLFSLRLIFLMYIILRQIFLL